MAATVVERIKTLKAANELTFDKKIEFKISVRPLQEFKIRQTSRQKQRSKSLFSQKYV